MLINGKDLKKEEKKETKAILISQYELLRIVHSPSPDTRGVGCEALRGEQNVKTKQWVFHVESS